MSGLDGKAAVITGASSGIGLATAEALSARGVSLVLHGRRGDLLESHAKRLGNAVALAAEITDPDTPQRLVDLALSSFGRCDIAYNNAGLIHVGGVDEVDLDKLSEMIRVNVEAAMRFMYTALRQFKRQGSGHLLSTSSVLGTKSRPGSGTYCATKYAIEAVSEALRAELAGTGVKVTCIQPGLVVTDLHRGWAVRPEKLQGLETPLVPADVARAVVYALEQPDGVLIPRVMVLAAGQAI